MTSCDAGPIQWCHNIWSKSPWPPSCDASTNTPMTKSKMSLDASTNTPVTKTKPAATNTTNTTLPLNLCTRKTTPSYDETKTTNTSTVSISHMDPPPCKVKYTHTVPALSPPIMLVPGCAGHDQLDVQVSLVLILNKKNFERIV